MGCGGVFATTNITRLHQITVKLGLALLLTNEALAFMLGIVRGSIRLYDLTPKEISEYQLVSFTAKIATSKYEPIYVSAGILDICALVLAVVSVATLRSKRASLHFAASVPAGPLLMISKVLYVIHQYYVEEAWRVRALSLAADVLETYSYVEQRFARAAGFWDSPTFIAIGALIGIAAPIALIIGSVTAWSYHPTSPSEVQSRGRETTGPSPPLSSSLETFPRRETKFCRMCGARIPADSKFCEFCGSGTTIQ